MHDSAISPNANYVGLTRYAHVDMLEPVPGYETMRDLGEEASRAAVQAAASMGTKVRALREEQGLTQEQLAHLAGISRNQIQNIEHSRNNQRDASGRPGPGNARLDTVFKLAFALEVSPMYLIDVAAKQPERTRAESR